MSEDLDKWFEEFVNESGFYRDDAYERIKADYDIEIKKRLTKMQVTLTYRDIPAVLTILDVSKNQKSLSTSIQLPNAKELTAYEFEIAEHALKKQGALNMVGYLNGELVSYDLSEGIKGLARQNLSFATTIGAEEEDLKWDISHRKIEHYYVFYLQNRWRDLFCLWIDENEGEVAGANWINVPMDKGFWLSPSLYSFIDKALKENGDFDVYGNVTGGLAELIQYFDVQIKDNKKENSWSVSVDPRDGHGHFLHFDIDKTNGVIDGVLAGHYDPAPPLEPVDF